MVLRRFPCLFATIPPTIKPHSPIPTNCQVEDPESAVFSSEETAEIMGISESDPRAGKATNTNAKQRATMAPRLDRCMQVSLPRVRLASDSGSDDQVGAN